LTGYEYGESPVFLIGYGDGDGDGDGDEDGDVHIPAIIHVLVISTSSFKLLKYSQLIK